MKKLLTVLLLFVSGWCVGQAPAIEWQKCYGGTNSDYPHSIQQTSDEGYIVAGNSYSDDGDITASHGNSDFWVIKIDNIGTIQWQKSFGGTETESAQSIQQTMDGGYIIAGLSGSNDGDVTGNHGYRDYWIVKLNSLGSIEWQKSIGGTNHDWAYSIQQTSDEGYIVAGKSESMNGDVSDNSGGSDYWVVKLNEQGSIQWEKSMGGTGNETPTSIQQTNDGGYIVAGSSNSNDGDVLGNHGNMDYWIVKLDYNGTIEWQKSMGGTGKDNASSIHQTNDGGYIVGGYSSSIDGDVIGHHGSIDTFDYWVLKLDSIGTIEWQKSFGGTNYDVAYSLQKTNGGGYIIAGYSKSTDGDVSGNHGGYNCNALCPDFWVVKLYENGNIQWQKSLGGTGDDQATSIKQTNDGGFIVVGWSTSDNGNITSNHGSFDYWVVKLGGPLAIEDLNDNIINFYPNPATTTLTLTSEQPLKNAELKIMNAIGQEVKQLSIINYPLSIDISQFPTGLYYLTLQSAEGTASKKLEVIR